MMKNSLLVRSSWVITLVLVDAVALFAQQASGNSGQTVPVMVLVKKGPGGAIYRVNGRDVTTNPLRGIAEFYEKHGGNNEYPVLAVVDDRLPIRMLSEVSGLIGKVGFSNVRYFRWAADFGKMREISFGRVYPFSEARPPQSLP